MGHDTTIQQLILGIVIACVIVGCAWYSRIFGNKE